MTQVLELANMGEVPFKRLELVPTFGDFTVTFIM